MDDLSGDLEVELTTEQEKAIIKGKTNVSFKTFVQLILQRKVFGLFKQWGTEPVIIDSDLLTELASAPGDTQENKSHLLVVTLGIGIVGGVFIAALIEFLLSFFGFELTQIHYIFVIAVILGIALLVSLLIRLQKAAKSDKLVESLEKAADFLKK